MKASEVPIGSGFLGSMWSEDWHAHKKPGKPIPGELIDVRTIVPGASCDDGYLKELLLLHANHLSSESSSQLSTRQAFWVVGVRETRSVKVTVFDWSCRRSESYLESLHEMLRQGAHIPADNLLEQLADNRTPYV